MKKVFLDFLKSVTVLQSSRLWKTAIHHHLSSLDTWLWPWAINSIADVLQQLRLNNYIEEERTFSTRTGSPVDGHKYGWRGVIWKQVPLQNGFYAKWNASCGWRLWWSRNANSWRLPCRAAPGCNFKVKAHWVQWLEVSQYNNFTYGFNLIDCTIHRKYKIYIILIQIRCWTVIKWIAFII